MTALLANVSAAGNVTTSGDIGNRYTWLALGIANITIAGASDIAMSALMRRTCPGYGCMLAGNETTLSESWFDAASESHNHAMLGHVDEYFYRYVAGIQYSRPQLQLGGSRARASASSKLQLQRTLGAEVIISPHPLPGLDWVNASFTAPEGVIAVYWRRVGGGAIDLEVELPPGVRGSLVMPGGMAQPLSSGVQMRRMGLE